MIYYNIRSKKATTLLPAILKSRREILDNEKKYYIAFERVPESEEVTFASKEKQFNEVGLTWKILKRERTINSSY